jgi:hypothetical protein
MATDRPGILIVDDNESPRLPPILRWALGRNVYPQKHDQEN